MKTVLLIATLATSCTTAEERWMSEAARPIVLTAESDNGCIVLTDANGRCMVNSSMYALSSTISQSYSVGDTLKP